MTAGWWLVVEDINLAPPDVLAAMLPLMESGRLYLPQRAEVITAAPGFQLLSSVTSTPGCSGAGAYSTTAAVEVPLLSLSSLIFSPFTFNRLFLYVLTFVRLTR
jgi:hypothetical protein